MHPRGETQMRWFRKLIWRLTKRAWEDSDEFAAEEDSGRPGRRIGVVTRTKGIALKDETAHGDQLRAQSMIFRLYNCVGGHVLETQVYDSRKDEYNHTLYMIRDEDDFAKQIAQSIMVEMMKQ
jgi:hypothetical protein